MAPIEPRAKVLLEPLKASFPTIKLVWGDRNSAGSMIEWMREHLDWTMQPVRALTVPKGGVLVAEGEQVECEKLFPKGFRPLPRRWVVERSLAWITRLSTALRRP